MQRLSLGSQGLLYITNDKKMGVHGPSMFRVQQAGADTSPPAEEKHGEVPAIFFGYFLVWGTCTHVETDAHTRGGMGGVHVHAYTHKYAHV